MISIYLSVIAAALCLFSFCFFNSNTKRYSREKIDLSTNHKFEENNEQLTNWSEGNTIINYYIEKHSKKPYNLLHPSITDPSAGQPFFVDKLLQYKRNGFFVECGAFDGEYLSNTLFFERYRNWTGLLIEADPDSYKMLKTKQRKAFTLNACLSINPFPTKELFFQNKVGGKIVTNGKKRRTAKYIQQQCFPIYDILLAVDRLEVDYFSLDIEGSEKEVLDTIPWENVDIKVMSIEYIKWKKGKADLINYMEKRGYMAKTELKSMYVEDIIFIKKNTFIPVFKASVIS